MKKRFGFTLAEVLITLGIIGVVAAMTIPTLIQNTNSIKFVTQFKKSVSTLSQAALMGQAQYDMDYGSLKSGSTPTLSSRSAIACDQQHLGKGDDTFCAMFNSTLAGQAYQNKFSAVLGADASTTYKSLLKTKTSGWYGDNYPVFAMADGSWVGFNNEASGCSLTPGAVVDATALGSTGGLKNCLGFIDVNGPQGPNEEVTCANGTAAIGNGVCALSATGKDISDVYPIVFHDGTVEPATNAARAAISRGKSNS